MDSIFLYMSTLYSNNLLPNKKQMYLHHIILRIVVYTYFIVYISNIQHKPTRNIFCGVVRDVNIAEWPRKVTTIGLNPN